jgi:hypothetical protein
MALDSAQPHLYLCPMPGKLHRIWQTFRPVLTGWLVVALLLPAVLGLTPRDAAAAINAPSHLAELCSTQDQGKVPAEHQNHNEDCPCCMPQGLAFSALVPEGVVFDTPRLQAAPAVFGKSESVDLLVGPISPFLARGPPLIRSI